MPVVIKLPTPLRRHADQARSVEVAASNVGQALQALVQTYPKMGSAIFAESGEVKPFVRVFVEGRDIADLQGGDTAVQDGDVISIVPPVAGA